MGKMSLYYMCIEEIAPNIVMLVPLAVGTSIFAGVPFTDQPRLRVMCRLKPASSRKTQLRSKSISSSVNHSWTLFFLSFKVLSELRSSVIFF